MIFVLADIPRTIFTFAGLILKYLDIILIITLLALPLIGNSFVEILISLVRSSTKICSNELNLILTRKTFVNESYLRP